MRQTIYFGDKPLLLTTEAIEYKNPTQALVQDVSEASIRALINTIQSKECEAAVLAYPDFNAMIEALKKQFYFIQAAGGLVWSDKGRILLIFRKGKWDLPKGKLDEGEDLQQCAVREVEEETGLKNVSILEPLCKTYHTYFQDGNHCLKESHWYLMQAPQMDGLTPQTEEDIEQCIWVAPEGIEPYFENIHSSVADVLRLALPLLPSKK